MRFDGENARPRSFATDCIIMDFEIENINILNTNTIEGSIKRKDEAICKEIYNLYKYASCLLKIYDATGYANNLDDQLSQDTTYRDYCFNNKETFDKDDDLSWTLGIDTKDLCHGG